MATKTKGSAPKAMPAAPKARERVTAPLSPKAPRIMVTDSNRSVEWHVEAAGGLPIRAGWSPETAVRDLASCDGLIITGGGDVNPELYGQRRHPQVYGTTPSRDIRELALIGAARHLGIPVLGICRGLQVIAVEAGGKLYQHIPDRVHHDEHSCSMMPVRTVRGSQVARALGENPEMLHLHHQSVRVTPKGFAVTARHSDGTVEAIESHDGRVMGVQFHPESTLGLSGHGHTGHRLFETFSSACERYRRRARDKGRVALPTPGIFVDAWPVAKQAEKAASGWWDNDRYIPKTVVTPPQRKATNREPATKESHASVRAVR